VIAESEILHGSCVAVQGRGLLILGPSGSGKSSLAMRLLSLGAGLVSDDRTALCVERGRLIARCPAAIFGLIEARGLGLLHCPALDQAEVTLVADLGQTETERLPPARHVTILGCRVGLVLHPHKDHFPDALMIYLRYGRQA
jgi:HPr kinase/phosphorylase